MGVFSTGAPCCQNAGPVAVINSFYLINLRILYDDTLRSAFCVKPQTTLQYTYT